MIWRLLRKNISVGQIAGYALANLIGLAIVLSAIRFYGDVSAAVAPDADEGDSLLSADYLVISKPVSVLNTISKKSTEFSKSEIDDIASQPWAAGVGEFSAADFSVTGAVNLAGHGLQSYMFLESIPDEFIDIKPDGWNFDPSLSTDYVVPIILSKDYLSLYNFGFATSRGLPQISEGVVSEVPVMLQFTGSGHTDVYRAKVVGFSSRLNTIAVPDDFMRWANDRYGSLKSAAPSRLIVKVNRPGDPDIDKYIKSHDYEVAGDKLDNSKASYFLTLLTSIVITIGAIISALALFILMLSIHLLLQKNHDKISNLLLLGYTPAQVAAGYYKLIGCINLGVLVVAIGAMVVASSIWESRLSALSISPSSPLRAIVAGIVIVSAITAVNFVAISRRVRSAFR